MELLPFVIQHCLDNKISFTIEPSEEIDYPGSDFPCSGYFIVKDDKPRLGIAAGAVGWQETLLHELCHSMQWLENSPFWQNNYLTEAECQKFGIQGSKVEAVDLIDMWTSHKVELSHSPEELLSLINRATLVEADCEKRTAVLGNQFIKNFDASLYARKANSYLRLYKFVQAERRWGKPGASVWLDPVVLAAQQDTFDQDYTSSLSEAELQVYHDYLARDWTRD